MSEPAYWQRKAEAIERDREISLAQSIPLLATCSEMQMKARVVTAKLKVGTVGEDPLDELRAWLREDA